MIDNTKNINKLMGGRPSSSRYFSASTPNFKTEAAQKLAKLFPEIVADGQIDVDALEEILSPDLEEVDSNEKYEFTWRGKRNAKRIADTPACDTTLIADKKYSKGWNTTKNVYIEGDNLEILKLMQKAYSEKIKVIYIDPPYNTGHDFVYKDNYHDSYENYLKETGQLDNEGNVTTTNRESSGRFHTNWLNMMYPRLKLARNLLTDNGVIFISIDDNEHANLLKVCNEIFGESNYISSFVWKRRTSSAMSSTKVSVDHEYVVCYRKDNLREFRGIEKDYKDYSNPDNDPRGDWTTGDLTVGMNADQRPNQYYTLIDPKTGIEYKPNYSRVWSYTPDSMQKLIDENYIVFPSDSSKRPMKKRFKSELKDLYNPFSSWVSSVGLNTEGNREFSKLFDKKSYFSYAKPISLITSLIEQVSSKNDIVLDFFSGSGTTAQAVMELNAKNRSDLKFILIQLPEMFESKSQAYKDGFKTISEVAEERIRRAGNEIESKYPNATIDSGFKVFKLQKSTIKQWDNNPDNFESQLELIHSPFTQDSTNEQRALEIAIKSGINLEASPEVDGDNYHFVTSDKEVFVILGNYDEKLLEKLNNERKLSNATVVLREMDSGSEIKFNLIEKLKQEPELNDHFNLEWL